jgi:hypothetical protein
MLWYSAAFLSEQYPVKLNFNSVNMLGMLNERCMDAHVEASLGNIGGPFSDCSKHSQLNSYYQIM